MNLYMVYFDKKNYKLVGFQTSKTKNKMYDAIIKSKLDKIHLIPFGDKRYENFQDKTGLNLYPNLIHNDKIRRKNYRSRHRVYVKDGFYSPSYFSYYYLW